MAEVKHNIIYPAYINKNRTVAKGRRIPLQYAVPDPKPHEVLDGLFSLKGFVAQLEHKPYCRETDKESMPYRVKYHNASPEKNNLANKRQILVACAKRINDVRSRSGPPAGQSSEGGSGKHRKKNK